MRPQKQSFFNKRNVMGLFIIFLMVSSILAIWQGGTDTPELPQYNTYTFSIRGEYILTEIEGNEVTFRYHPQDLERISVGDDTRAWLKRAVRYHITFDPEDAWVQYIDILRMDIAANNFLEKFNRQFSDATTQPSTVYTLPLITCQNATDTQPVLYFKKSNITTLTREGNCLLVEAATPEDLLKAKDVLIYMITGVI